MTTSKHTYRWAHPIEWLDEKITALSQADRVDELCSLARELGAKLDGDTIQDLFESEMDADGYFKPVVGGAEEEGGDATRN